jgi:hypothetical protein
MRRSPRKYKRVLWSGSEDERLRELASRYMRAEVTEILNREFGTQRSSDSITCRAALLGIDMWMTDPYWTSTQLEAFFSCDTKSIRRVGEMGLLPLHHVAAGTAGARSKFGEWRTRESEVEQFIRSQPWAYNPERLFPPQHRLARIGRALHRRSPWLSVAQCARMVDATPSAIRGWIRRGAVPHTYRLLGTRGSWGKRGFLIISVSDVPAIREEIARRRALARISAIEKTREVLRQRREQRAA